jgi:hypothetical protein
MLHDARNVPTDMIGLQPVPTQPCVICTSKLSKQEGRKLFLEASIDDIEGKEHYVDSTALFINMKANTESIVTDNSGPLATLQTQPDISDWNDCPRYSNVCKEIGL